MSVFILGLEVNNMQVFLDLQLFRHPVIGYLINARVVYYRQL